MSAEDIDFLNSEIHRLLRETYDRLARESRVVGDDDSTRIWRSLHRDCVSNDRGPRRSDQTIDSVTALERVHFDTRGEITNASLLDLSSPYAMWSFAVRNQTSICDAFIELAANARAPAARQRALSYARLAMDRAADYRVLRRAAYHTDLSDHRQTAFVSPNRVQTVRDLEHIALALERWCAALLRARSDLLHGLDKALQLTEAAVAELEDRIGADPPRKQLESGLDRLGKRTAKFFFDHRSSARAYLEVHSECERIFDYYNTLFETASDEALLNSAQAMSHVAISRLRSLRNAATYFDAN
jgi:hypothetical protein